MTNSEVKNDIDNEMKELCDKMMEETRPKFLNPELEPVGPNIFLSVQIDDEYSSRFLCLEREMKNTYIVTLMTKPKNKITNLKRRQVWNVNENKSEKILKTFSDILNRLKGV